MDVVDSRARMSDDEDLFGENEDSAMQVEQRSSGSLVARPAVNAEDSDDNLFGSDHEGRTSKTVTQGEQSRTSELVDSDDDLVNNIDVRAENQTQSQESKLTSILGVGPSSGLTSSKGDGPKAIHLRDRTMSKLYLPPTEKIPEDTTKLYIRLPESLKIQSDRYDKAEYNAANEKAEFGSTAKEGKTVIISDVIRWRFKTDADGAIVKDPVTGAPQRESNARLQKMKNGTYRLVVGNSVFNAPTNVIADSYLYTAQKSVPPANAVLTEEEELAGVTLATTSNLTCVADMNGSVKLNYFADERNVNVLFNNAKIKNTYTKKGKLHLANTKEIVERPEIVAERNQKAEELRSRIARREREMNMDRDGIPRTGAEGHRGGIGMRSDYLNADDGYGDGEEQYESYNIRDIKNGKPEKPRSRAAAVKKTSGRRYDDNDDDDRFAAATKAKSKKNKDGKKRGGDDSDDGLDDSDGGDFSDDVDDDGEDLDDEEEDSDDAEDDDADLDGFIDKGEEADDDSDDDEDGIKNTKYFKKGNKPVKTKAKVDEGGSEGDVFSDDSDEEQAQPVVKTKRADTDTADADADGDGDGEGKSRREEASAAPVKKRAKRVVDSDDDDE